VFVVHAETKVIVTVAVEPAMTFAGRDDTLLGAVRFVDEVPTYTVVIFALLVPVFRMTTLIAVEFGHETFSSTSITPACCV
jgi:hypothetical protein